MKSLELVIEGCKGAGKGTTLRLIQESLAQNEISHRVCAPFADARDVHRAATGEEEFAHLWGSSPEERERAERMVEDAIAAGRKAAHEACEKVLLFDRGWMTVVAAMEQSGMFRSGEEKEAAIRKWCTDQPPTYFLSIPAEMVVQRRGALFYDAKRDAESALLIQKDCDLRTKLCEENPRLVRCVLDTSGGAPDFKKAADSILADIYSSLNRYA